MSLLLVLLLRGNKLADVLAGLSQEDLNDVMVICRLLY